MRALRVEPGLEDSNAIPSIHIVIMMCIHVFTLRTQGCVRDVVFAEPIQAQHCRIQPYFSASDNVRHDPTYSRRTIDPANSAC